jgi:hypothetical protein
VLTSPVAKGKRESGMAKIDLDSLSIEELASMREYATDKLMEKVAARRAELEAELEKLSQYDRPAKKSVTAVPVVKVKKADDKKADGKVDETNGDEVKEPVAKAA